MKTLLEAQHLEEVISRETGLAFEADAGVDTEGQQWYLLRPPGLLSNHTFGIRTTLEWRRLRIDFVPGKFAGALLADMGNADIDGRAAFQAILSDSCDRGAKVDLKVNDVPFSFDDADVWAQTWNRLVLTMSKGSLELGIDDDEGEQDARIVCHWTGRIAAAVVATLPTEEVEESVESDVIGYPEGTFKTVQTNRYERDRRNRAAAIAIHGTDCKGCGLQMDERYGSVAAGLIEVHHITPVSELGEAYLLDPVKDLVPLCPNCHAVVHRRSPPLAIGELQELIAQP